MPPRNFFDSGCCIPETLGTAVITGCLSFGATGSLRLPNRTTFPAGTCGGAGAIRHDTTLNAIVYRFGGPVTGPVLQIPPATGVPAPVPVQVSDDGVNAPTISPLGTLSTQPFGDQSDARWVVGLPNGALAPSLANSVFHLEPNLAAGTTTLTVKPFVGGAVGTTWIVDLPNAATTTLSLTNSLAGVADLSVDGTVQGLTGVQGGTAGAQVTLGTVGGVPTLGTSLGKNLNIAPAGGGTTITGTANVTGLLTASGGLTVVGAFTLPVQTAGTVFAGPTTGVAAVPTFRGISALSAAATDFSSILGGNLILGGPAGGGAGVPFFRGLVTADLPAGTGTVTSVGLTMPAIFSVAGSPVTTSGTLAVTLANQAANLVFASPDNAAGAPTFRTLVAVTAIRSDFASIAAGRLFLGGPAGGGAGVPFFRALATADLPAGTGTVTSVALTMPAIFSVAGSPITTSGTLAVTLANATAGTVFAGPTTGAATTPAFRGISAVAIGTTDFASILGGNLILGGPVAGGAGFPFFRGLVALDIPTTLNSTTISTQLTVTTIVTPAATNLTIAPTGGTTNVTGALATTTTITGTTINATTGINTGAGAGTLRLDSAGALSNITSLTLTGAIATATTINASGNIVTSGGGISAMDGNLASPAAGVIHGTTVRGGRDGATATGYVQLSNIGTLPAITTPTAYTTLHLWPAYPNAGTTVIDTRTAFTVNANVHTFDFVGGATKTFNVQDSASATTYLTVSGTGTNVAAGVLAMAGSTIVTTGKVLNNLDIDGGATGNILRLNQRSGAGVPTAPTNTRQLDMWKDSTPGSGYLVWKDPGGLSYYVKGTQV